MTVIQYKIRRFATIQSDFGHIWEQEAASSSLATPILQTHVDSIRVNVRFYFAGKLDVENSNACKNCAHCKAAF